MKQNFPYILALRSTMITVIHTSQKMKFQNSFTLLLFLYDILFPIGIFNFTSEYILSGSKISLPFTLKCLYVNMGVQIDMSATFP